MVVNVFTSATIAACGSAREILNTIVQHATRVAFMENDSDSDSPMTDLSKDETMRVAQPRDMVVGAVIYNRIGTKWSVLSEGADGYFNLQMDLQTYPDRHLLLSRDTGERLMRPKSMQSARFYVLREK